MERELFLAVIVSIDTYLASAAYCNSGIKIPAVSGGIISVFGAAVLGVAIFFAGFISRFISSETIHNAQIVVLVAIGTFTILKSLIRQITKKLSDSGELSFRMGSSPLIVKLYLDVTAADSDNSKILTAAEAAALAVASSFDSAAIGLSSSDANPLTASIFTFFCGAAAVFLGNVTGKKISSLKTDLSWIGGSLLIIFAFTA